MIKYLLDTNILLRSVDKSSEFHLLANNAIKKIISNGNECVITAQVLIEFWVVATRPVDVNGLDWDSIMTKNYINDLLENFIYLRDNAEIFTYWLDLVTTYNIKGKRTHDLRILAVMLSHNITHLLTFNPRDFVPIPTINIIRPQELLKN